MCAASGSAQTTLYVDDDAPLGGDGLAWTTAYRFLQDALADAEAIGNQAEIRIAQGEYRPDRDEVYPLGTGDREASFVLVDGVPLIGGYAGTDAPDPNERDVAAYETILTGDLAGDDGPEFENNEENSLHVLRGTDMFIGATLDGLTITRGNADDEDDDERGAGGFFTNCSLTLTQCTITENAAYQGGGLYNRNSGSAITSLSITACAFTANNYQGIYNKILDASVFHALVTECTFEHNTGAGFGVRCEQVSLSSSVLTDCLFSENQTTGNGCAIFHANTHTSACDLSVLNCEFLDNIASDDYGMYDFSRDGGSIYAKRVHSSSHLEVTLTDSVFVGNSCTGMGGAVRIAAPVAEVRNCLFLDNRATGSRGYGGYGGEGGGLMLAGSIQNVISDCTFSGNQVGDKENEIPGLGGGLEVYACTNPVIKNCSFIRNGSHYYGGGVILFGNTPGSFINCEFTGNTAAEHGGGVSMQNNWYPANFINSTFVGNTSGIYGGALGTWASETTFTNCTLIDNAAPIGSVISSDEGTGSVHNSIMWGIGDMPIDTPTPVQMTYSCIEGGYEGAGNIDGDPLFTKVPDSGLDGEWGTEDDDYGDLHLMTGSPCIDAGDNGEVPEDVTTDLDGNPRFVDDPDTEDTGLGDPPIVDMGAYEFQTSGCPADVTGDGTVDVLDLLAVLAAWGPCEPDCPEDINGDGVVDVLDMLEVLAAWGPCT